MAVVDPLAYYTREKKTNDELSKREIEVLKLVAEGMSNKDICAQFWLSPHTVSRHMKSIFRKLKVKNRTQAALWAWRNGLMD